ncbi:ubiquitin carboxyl-terminal hydrolase CYLD-like [Portunus trituberculatus]|uniref:ubiquitin carboxyl-terminal hydrolase CYLD-like n=1 Tax=Portunus trituberculatus TaxID=210409 RepID=UPI001E1CFF0F|nr:ubiquitin carboxyl-terminal hydrolase CYLD-like [Portunus trituberculatus]XP_045113227.1 ubiquitin carboxyl-terminal hydrolase CYLD-like [Portunus trituberculatus]XP_045113228.1 ubiquitin carboxyl-terminal hydrolase CYLD-like [Portunus trituberculatus]XP_045113229.1 ubiquitin carboxyl-terminal hydrolase CYLD-like [Portunus trituberculatus]XP_045113231.1 ubiquitin carboxyl-terminal hydrolase CYLD-like [Portunus trituberculatus]XP_045113232.1 ubiquitin carboxyl-terminal hydrolase CYLD-like [P
MDGGRRKLHNTTPSKGGGGDECALSVGDKVVWLSDDYPEFGVVRWTGKLPGSADSTSWKVGVEFDNPVGNDNHKVNGRLLFEAEPGHASVLPVNNLVKAEDLLGKESLTLEHGGRPAPPKRPAHVITKSDNQLGTDMNSMTPFHMLAFEQLTTPTSQRGPGPPPPYSEKDWELLPHMTYGQKNSMTNKDSGHEHKPRQRDKGKILNRNMEKKNNKWKSSGCSSGRPLQVNSEPEQTHPVGSFGDSDFPVHPLCHLSLHGIDQLEVVSDGDGVYDTPEGSLDGEEDLDIGSMVEVVIKEVPRFGVIRWIGSIPGDKKDGRKAAGVEMEDSEDGLSDGTFSGKRYFSCAPGKALFVLLRMCHKDSRFLESVSSNPRASLAFGSMDCQPVGGSVAPLSAPDDVRAMFGKNRGIQGHQNSCYLDATLFSMFAFTSVFDNLLFRPQTAHDIKEYNEVQRVLREEIVNPLRANLFVRADRIMKLRTMLDHLSSVRGLTTEEKDPEEFLHSLLAQILQAEPLLQLSSGQEAYHYQLFVDKDEKLNLPSVQTLFDQSFLTSDIKLKQVPSCLIIQMPRFGKDYKMYPRILPSMVLDVTDVIEDSPRQCIICGKLAEYECRECFGQCGSGLESIAFCAKCMDKVHSHKKRGAHASTRRLKVPPDFQMLADHCGTIPRVYMELFAVVCIETSHYVAFTRCGSGADATWCFFDSMADRKGEQHGYNIPTVVECGDLMQWVGDEGSQMLHAVTDNKALPDLPRRLLCDAYMCFYQSPKVMMYR